MKKILLATIQVAIQIDATDEPADVISATFTENLVGNNLIADWQYLPNYEIIVFEGDTGNYAEGDVFRK